jgi:hypothetical protein
MPPTAVPIDPPENDKTFVEVPAPILMSEQTAAPVELLVDQHENVKQSIQNADFFPDVDEREDEIREKRRSRRDRRREKREDREKRREERRKITLISNFGPSCRTIMLDFEFADSIENLNETKDRRQGETRIQTQNN